MSKFFDIKTRIVLDPASTSKAVQEFTKHLTALQKTGAFANMASDLKKVEPMLKIINKEALGLSKNFVEAFKSERMAQVNKALKEQSALFTANAKSLEQMRKAYEGMSGAQKNAQRAKIEQVASEQSMLMMGMQDLMQERNREKGERIGRNANRLRSAAGVFELGHEAQVAAINKSSGEGIYRTGARAQAQEPGNQLAGQFLSSPLVGANIARAMKKEKVFESAQTKTQGEIATAMLDIALKPTVAGLEAGADALDNVAKQTVNGMGAGGLNAAQGIAGSAYEGAKGLAKAGVATAGSYVKEYMGDNHYLHNTRTSQVTQDAMTGANTGQGMASTAVLEQIRSQLLQNLSSNLPTLSAGYEASGSGGLMGNLHRGAARGFRPGETVGLQQQTYHNFTGSDQGDTSTFQRMQRAGAGNAAQLAGAAGGFSSSMKTGQISQFKEMFETAVSKGVDKSKFMDFAASVSEVAANTGMFLESISGLTNQMLQALGTGDLSKVNRGEMAAAKDAINARQAIGNNEIGMAQRMTDIKSSLGEKGNKLDSRVLASLAGADDASQIDPIAKKLLKQALGSEEYEKFMAGFDKNQKRSDMKSLSAGGLVTQEGLESTDSDTRDKNQLGLNLGFNQKTGTALGNLLSDKMPKDVKGRRKGAYNSKLSGTVANAQRVGAQTDMTMLNQSLVVDKKTTEESIAEADRLRKVMDENNIGSKRGSEVMATLQGQNAKYDTSVAGAVKTGANAIGDVAMGNENFKIAADALADVTKTVSSALDNLKNAINSKAVEFINMKMGSK